MRYYINVSVPEDVYHIYQSIPQGQRGWVIGRLIRAWYQAGQKRLLPSRKKGSEKSMTELVIKDEELEEYEAD